MVKYLSFHISSFALRYFLMEMARPQCDTPLIFIFWGAGNLCLLCTGVFFGQVVALAIIHKRNEPHVARIKH